MIRYVGSVYGDETTLADLAIRSQAASVYHIFVNDSSGTFEAMTVSVTPCFWDWTVISCAISGNNTFVPQALFRFRYNVDSGAISNSNTPTILQNFTPYPTVLLAAANYKSGTLGGYAGSISAQGEYSDTIQQRDALYALSNTQNAIFLKNRKGDLIRIRVSAPTTVSTADATREQAQQFVLSWAEVADATDAKLPLSVKDALWEQIIG